MAVRATVTTGPAAPAAVYGCTRISAPAGDFPSQLTTARAVVEQHDVDAADDPPARDLDGTGKRAAAVA